MADKVMDIGEMKDLVRGRMLSLVPERMSGTELREKEVKLMNEHWNMEELEWYFKYLGALL